MSNAFDTAKRHLRGYGMTLTKHEGEYRVNFRGGSESTAYYTTSLDDAVATGRAEAEARCADAGGYGANGPDWTRFPLNR